MVNSLCPYVIEAGSKSISGFLMRDGRVRLLCDCDVFPDACVQVFVSPEQAEELMLPRTQRRLIQAILPEHSREIREMLLFGTTPAEWDEMYGEVKPIEQYGCYKIDE